MTMMRTSGLACLEDTPVAPRRLDLPAEIRPAVMRIGDAAHAARVTTLSAMGVDLELGDASGAELALAEEIVVVIPSLGQYRARRLRMTGTRATYLFDLTEFSRRALGALIADRFPD
ncbi:MAG: hypothetical protein HLUCCO18_05780 [Rhodobacteraceae bacterium HLUCCO18]|nr:MAG: hypothetical protein HLUCCO18_05780 [Rhodobacteraceae bacterium HLUCCO18]